MAFGGCCEAIDSPFTFASSSLPVVSVRYAPDAIALETCGLATDCARREEDLGTVLTVDSRGTALSFLLPMVFAPEAVSDEVVAGASGTLIPLAAGSRAMAIAPAPSRARIAPVSRRRLV